MHCATLHALTHPHLANVVYSQLFQTSFTDTHNYEYRKRKPEQFEMRCLKDLLRLTKKEIHRNKLSQKEHSSASLCRPCQHTSDQVNRVNICLSRGLSLWSEKYRHTVSAPAWTVPETNAEMSFFELDVVMLPVATVAIMFIATAMVALWLRRPPRERLALWG